jgi:hypothetical protein
MMLSAAEKYSCRFIIIVWKREPIQPLPTNSGKNPPMQIAQERSKQNCVAAIEQFQQ